jgi:hypothetical protein
MNAERHLAKAKEIEGSLEQLLPDPDGRNVVAIVELTYGILQHLIAIGCERNLKEHKNSHVGLAAFLRSHKQEPIADVFEKIDQYRAGRWYGGKGNGKIVAECLNALNEVKKWSSKKD